MREFTLNRKRFCRKRPPDSYRKRLPISPYGRKPLPGRPGRNVPGSGVLIGTVWGKCSPRVLVKVTLAVVFRGNWRSTPMALWSMYCDRRFESTRYSVFCDGVNVESEGTL